MSGGVKFRGYATLLVGQSVPYANAYDPPPDARPAWQAVRRDSAQAASRAMTVEQTLAALQSPTWKCAS